MSDNEKKTEEKTPQAAPAGGGVSWGGSAEAMFERMIQEVPESLHEVFRGKLMGVVVQKTQGEPATEELIEGMVKEMVPEPFKTNILKAFATMGGLDLSVVDEILEKNPGGQEVIINVLHAVQAEFGYIPEEALILIEQKTNVALSALYRLVTSYQAFCLEEPGEHTISVCSCTACYVKGAGIVYKDLEDKLTKSKANVTLKKMRNLGCCNVSPAVMIDGEVYSGVADKAKIEEFVR
jgi:NADH:ubiquinone oxidoreductase subunit E